MKRELIAVVAALLVPSAGLAVADEGAKLLGDESDGSRALPLHLIPLYPENEDGEKGEQIDPEAADAMPFSTKHTCGQCHTYETVSRGWHFNAVDPNVAPGRPGEPWVYFSPKLGIQIPLSYRAWPGTFRPEAVGLTAFDVTKIYGRHMPGGGPGEVKPAADDIDGIGKQYVSGKLEINCLACHNAHPGQDMGSPTGWAVQVSARENFRWAAAASCEFAGVKGSAADVSVTYDPFMPDFEEKNAPTVTYDKNRFDENGHVLVEIEREAPNHRCYFCHSDLYYTHEEGQEKEKWSSDEDIHLMAGMTCVDCHRNGTDHNIIRGYDEETAFSDNALAATTSCRGCHLGDEHGKRPEGGRLGAPVPVHAGIPPVHFERLTCTACHSGPWPDDTTVLTKTSRAHRLGTPNVNKDSNVLPHIVSPVFAAQTVAAPASPTKDADPVESPTGKIAPHKLLWPAYWGRLAADGAVEPLPFDVVEGAIGSVFEDIEFPEDGGWPGMSDEQLTAALTALADVADSNAVYIAGGNLYRVNVLDKLVTQADHPAAAPYMWPIAHNVRPAAQSLGIRKCTDCHSPKKPFFFGDVTVDSPLASAAGATKEQITFQQIGRFGAWAFAASFVFRPFFKIVALGSCAIIGVVLLLYGLKALGGIARVLAEEE